MNRMSRRRSHRISNFAADMLWCGFITGCIAFCTIFAITDKPEPPAEDVQAAAEMVTAEQTTAPIIETDRYIAMDVPEGDTAFKSYMSYKAITNTLSHQYDLQKYCWTDGCGLRRYKTYYVVALGTFYADYIGERFRITTDEGNVIECVAGDFKADRDTDERNQYTPMQDRKCVVEFIVDTRLLDDTVKRMGDVSYIDDFSGNVISVEAVK